MAMTEYFDSIHFCPFIFFALELDNYIYQLKNYHLKIYRYFVQMFKDIR